MNKIFCLGLGKLGLIFSYILCDSGYRIYGYDKNPKIKNGFGDVGIGKLAHIDDTPFNRYCLQQSMYKFILEKNYGISIKAMYIVVLHPDYANFYKFPIPYHKKEIEYILSSLK